MNSMSTNDELNLLLSNVKRFLKQEQELYGDVLLVGTKQDLMKKSEPKSQAPSVHSHPAEEDLFGEAVKPTVTKQAKTVASFPEEPWTNAADLDKLDAMICTCLKCGLGHTRKNFVFGVGNSKAEVVVIGEAPGADEDEQGEPFVGRAGQLLNKILEAVQFKREEVFICNILKCRPPDNRRPTTEEIECCEPYLWKQLELIQPKMILCLGLTAAQALLKTNASLTNLRGKWHDYRGIKTMVTYHPAALLRNPNWKRPTWEDVQLFRKFYDEMKSDMK